MVAVYASDHPLLSVKLVRLVDDDESDHAATFELCAAIDDLTADWLVPLGIAASIECCDPGRFYESSSAIKPPAPHHFLRVSELHPELIVQTFFSAPQVTTDVALDPETRRAWLDAALAQSCATGRVVALSEIWWTMVRARLPVRPELHHGGHPVASIVEEREGSLWALGPSTPFRVGPPACVRAANTHGGLELYLMVYWDAWIEQPEGNAWVNRGIERVRGRGRGWDYDRDD